jgi:salicylate hydroxylase/6-hydroxynicotinate 3-monooxygenase
MPREISRSRTKWWGEDRHIVIYYTSKDRSQLYFVTSVPEPADWVTRESWSAKGDVKELRAAYAGFHPEVRMVLDACPDCHKWAILERDPLPTWSQGRIVLIGDACHPMTPYMAQGAATSIEDAAVLARCLADDTQGPDRTLRRYESLRIARTTRLQQVSHGRAHLNHLPDGPEQQARDKSLADRDPLAASAWIYAHDPEAGMGEQLPGRLLPRDRDQAG